MSGLGLKMGRCSTSEDSDMVTLFGVCGWTLASGVAVLGLALTGAALDFDTGHLGLHGL